jgi:hypothetical protein
VGAPELLLPTRAEEEEEEAGRGKAVQARLLLAAHRVSLRMARVLWVTTVVFSSLMKML